MQFYMLTQKTDHWDQKGDITLLHNFSKCSTDFQNYFTRRCSSKFVIKSQLKIMLYTLNVFLYYPVNYLARFWLTAVSRPILCATLHYYQQHCAQRKPPVFSLLRGRFWGFSLRRGDTLHRWGWNLARRRGLKVPPPRQISPPSVQREGCRTPKNEFFYTDLTKIWNINAPQGRIIPCAISTKFAVFVSHFRMR